MDSIIDTAGTLYNAARALKDNGAKDIYCFASHAIFSGEAVNRLSDKSLFKKVVVTNSINLPEEKKFDNLEILSIAELLASAIQKVLDDTAMSPLFF